MLLNSTILTGDCRVVLPTLPAESVHCVVTSPPYWALRDNGHADQVGQEATVAGYVAAVRDCLAGVARVLRADGTLWLNLGDTYRRGEPVGVPWRVAFALRDAGWKLRSEVIWHKPDPMPESVTLRPSRSHEHVFLFSRSDRYFYDAVAVQEPAVTPPRETKHHGGGKKRVASGEDRRPHTYAETRNCRTVWTMTTGRYRGAHTSTFPVSLATRCILAGTSAHGSCAACGIPWRRDVRKERVPTRPGRTNTIDPTGMANRDPQRHVTRVETLGWVAGCKCDAPVAPCVVLDPFAGAGTVAFTARHLGRSSVSVELDPGNVSLIHKRLA